MVNTITLKELRPGLPEVIDRIDTKWDRYIVTRRGKPVCAMLSIEDYDAMLETIEILSDPAALKRIKKSKDEIRRGETIPWDKLRQELDSV